MALTEADEGRKREEEGKDCVKRREKRGFCMEGCADAKQEAKPYWARVSVPSLAALNYIGPVAGQGGAMLPHHRHENSDAQQKNSPSAPLGTPTSRRPGAEAHAIEGHKGFLLALHYYCALLVDESTVDGWWFASRWTADPMDSCVTLVACTTFLLAKVFPPAPLPNVDSAIQGSRHMNLLLCRTAALSIRPP